MKNNLQLIDTVGRASIFQYIIFIFFCYFNFKLIHGHICDHERIYGRHSEGLWEGILNFFLTRISVSTKSSLIKIKHR